MPGSAGASKRARPSQSSRRAGYSAALVVNIFLILALNYWPGWDILPFLTRETNQVMDWVNASLIVSVVANAIYLWFDPAWLKALGDAVTTAVGLFAVIQVWEVFPFRYDHDAWKVLTQALLGVAAVGSVLGIIAAVAKLARTLVRTKAERRSS